MLDRKTASKMIDRLLNAAFDWQDKDGGQDTSLKGEVDQARAAVLDAMTDQPVITNAPIGMYRVTLTDALAGIDCMFGPNGCTREGCVRDCYEKADAVLGVLKEFGKIE